MGTTKLRIFNGALVECGNRRLSDTGDEIESARELVAVYDQVVEECLSAGSWNFAMETIKADADTGVTPEFGYAKVFAKPSDWLRTVGVSEDEYFSYPLLYYYDDSTYWSADNTPIYARYVSNDTGLGLDLTRWPAPFCRYVELEHAARVVFKLTQNASLRDEIEKRRDKARKFALNRDAMDESQPKFPPPGSWTQARSGRIGRGDRGSRSGLTG
jgi:hypothetical protein